jgi:hypothetical protein
LARGCGCHGWTQSGTHPCGSARSRIAALLSRSTRPVVAVGIGVCNSAARSGAVRDVPASVGSRPARVAVSALDGGGDWPINQTTAKVPGCASRSTSPLRNLPARRAPINATIEAVRPGGKLRVATMALMGLSPGPANCTEPHAAWWVARRSPGPSPPRAAAREGAAGGCGQHPRPRSEPHLETRAPRPRDACQPPENGGRRVGGFRVS